MRLARCHDKDIAVFSVLEKRPAARSVFRYILFFCPAAVMLDVLMRSRPPLHFEAGERSDARNLVVIRAALKAAGGAFLEHLRDSLNHKNALSLCFIAFSSHEPLVTSLENALVDGETVDGESGVRLAIVG